MNVAVIDQCSTFQSTEVQRYSRFGVRIENRTPPQNYLDNNTNQNVLLRL